MAVELTERAAQHVKGFVSGESGQGLRLGVKPTGCSGYMYTVEIADAIAAHDRVFETQGITVIVDDQSLKYLDGTTVDYTRDGLNEGFRFENPNATATCGCGESFSL